MTADDMKALAERLREQAKFAYGDWPTKEEREDMIAAAQIIEQQTGEPVEIVPRAWRAALRRLTFMARTSGGTAGPDDGLKEACAAAESLLSKPYNYQLSASAEQAAEVERLRAEVEALKLQQTAAELVHRETATTVLMQMAEAETLRAKADAFDEWSKKTEWVLLSRTPVELGLHLADVMRQRIDALRAENNRLNAAVAEAMPVVRAYAERNPRREYGMQDPFGAHGWLERNDAAAVRGSAGVSDGK